MSLFFFMSILLAHFVLYLVQIEKKERVFIFYSVFFSIHPSFLPWAMRPCFLSSSLSDSPFIRLHLPPLLSSFNQSFWPLICPFPLCPSPTRSVLQVIHFKILTGVFPPAVWTLSVSCPHLFKVLPNTAEQDSFFINIFVMFKTICLIWSKEKIWCKGREKNKSETCGLFKWASGKDSLSEVQRRSQPWPSVILTYTSVGRFRFMLHLMIDFMIDNLSITVSIRHMEAINYAYPELKATTLQHNDLRLQPTRQDM